MSNLIRIFTTKGSKGELTQEELVNFVVLYKIKKKINNQNQLFLE